MNRVLQAMISGVGAGPRERYIRLAFRIILGGLAGIHHKLPLYLTGVASAFWAWALRYGQFRPIGRPPSRTARLAEAGRAFDHLPLFRPEAMAARRTGWLGSPQVSQPCPVHAVAAGSLAAVAALTGLIAFGSYTGASPFRAWSRRPQASFA